MKFNEPVRPSGIGRRQVAFETGRTPTAFTLIENEDNDGNDTNSQTGQDEAVLAQANAASRVIAYSAASSAMSNNQNDIWSTQSIQDWTHFCNNTTPTFSYIKWANPDPDNLDNIRSGLAYVDSNDPTIIKVNKPGWYLVSVNFYQGDHTLNNYKNELWVLNSDSPDTRTAKATIYSHGYPSLSICQVVSVPGYLSANRPVPNEPAISRNIGLQCLYQIDPHNSNLSITAANSYASIQIIWLRPFEANFFYNGA